MDVQPKLDELAWYLRPPGQGIHAVSTGKAELAAFTLNYLRQSSGTGEIEIDWRTHLAKIPTLRGKDAVALLAIPCDTGAGLVRGANRGPEAMRKVLKQAPAFELGDVFSVPHFLDEEALSESQKQSTRAAIYPSVSVELRKNLPVSPLGMAARVYQLVHELNPELRILLMGGDHSVAWPAMEVLLGKGPNQNRDLAIVHFDAHTDLLSSRLGVKYCFATWAYHANELLGRGERLLQIGIRASGKDQSYWEKKLGVRQIWAKEALALTPEQLADKVQTHLENLKIRRVYISNDIDGTDSRWASSCGTPEPDGLTPNHVVAVIQRLGQMEVKVIGADVVELAPGLSLDRELSRISVETATQYLLAELEVLRG